MRFLPDKPSLGFLRQEAKDLLATLRESDPDASLAVAQQSLAAQYGMRHWGELKSETERRATAAAPAPPDGLTDALAIAFGLGRVTIAAAPVSFTPMGRCWSIMTDHGRWLAATVYPWITDAQAEVGAQLRNAAAAKGIAAPTPVHSPQGRLIESVQGQSWRVHEWLEVGPSPVSPAPAAVARRIGSTYGTLHSLAFPSEAPINPYLTSRRPETDWESLLAQARAAHKPWAEQLSDALPTLYDLGTIGAEADKDKIILCNCNLIPENVRTGHSDELVIMEWDFAGSLTPELELGSALMHWTTQPSINDLAIKALRDGYVQAAGQWPRLEIASFTVAISGWLNWTYNTICEAINPSDEDQADVAERETLELLRRPLARSSLEQLLAVTR